MTKCFNPNLNGTPLAAAPVAWTRFDHLEGAAYIHLHDSENRILRLSGRAELVDNGCAPKLQPTPSIKPIAFDPTIQARMAVHNLKALVADFLPVHPDQRWIVISWLFSAFFLDLVRQRALLQISGEEGSGKSTVAEMLGCLLYGCSLDRSANQVQSRVEAGNPLLSLDPPQNGIGRLLLGLAQGIVRKPALAMFTGAGRGFEGLSPWIFKVVCRREFQQDYFLGSEHFAEIIHFRSQLLSGIFRLLARRVVPNLDEQRAQVLEKLSQIHPRHPRHQLDSFLALLTVILQALLGSLHGSSEQGESEAWRMVSGFIGEQT